MQSFSDILNSRAQQWERPEHKLKLFEACAAKLLETMNRFSRKFSMIFTTGTGVRRCVDFRPLWRLVHLHCHLALSVSHAFQEASR